MAAVVVPYYCGVISATWVAAIVVLIIVVGVIIAVVLYRDRIKEFFCKTKVGFLLYHYSDGCHHCCRPLQRQDLGVLLQNEGMTLFLLLIIGSTGLPRGHFHVLFMWFFIFPLVEFLCVGVGSKIEKVPRDIRKSIVRRKNNDKFGKGLVSTSRTYASPKGTGPGVRRSKRSLLACHTRCKCSMETTHNDSFLFINQTFNFPFFSDSGIWQSL